VAVAMQLIRVLFTMVKARRRYEPGKLVAQSALKGSVA
jgi:hypothetical protein